MVGLKVNAREKQVGSPSTMLKGGNVCLQARWLTSSDVRQSFYLLLSPEIFISISIVNEPKIYCTVIALAADGICIDAIMVFLFVHFFFLLF